MLLIALEPISLAYLKEWVNDPKNWKYGEDSCSLGSLVTLCGFPKLSEETTESQSIISSSICGAFGFTIAKALNLLPFKEVPPPILDSFLTIVQHGSLS